jgi:hypothetical protein
VPKYSDAEVQQALNGRKAGRRYPFPGNPSIEVAVKLLTESELDDVRLRAADFVKTKKANLIIDPEFLDIVIHRETVAAAFMDASATEEYFFEDAAAVATIDAQTVRALYELYMFHHQAMDPFAFASEEEVEELVGQLGKSETDAGRLSLYDHSSLRSFVLSMARMLRESSPKPKSSTGS